MQLTSSILTNWPIWNTSYLVRDKKNINSKPYLGGKNVYKPNWKTTSKWIRICDRISPIKRNMHKLRVCFCVNGLAHIHINKLWPMHLKSPMNHDPHPKNQLKQIAFILKKQADISLYISYITKQIYKRQTSHNSSKKLQKQQCKSTLDILSQPLST